jgi:hypothetical protein
MPSPAEPGNPHFRDWPLTGHVGGTRSPKSARMTQVGPSANRVQTSGVGRHRTGCFGRSICRSGHFRRHSVVAAFDPICRSSLGTKNRISATAKSPSYASNFFEVSSLTRHPRRLVVPLLNKAALERALALVTSMRYLLSGKHGRDYVDQRRFCSAP